MTAQRVRVGVALLMDRIDAKIKEREAGLQHQAATYKEQRQKWFNAAEEALRLALISIQAGKEPEDLRYGAIPVKIDLEWPEEPDIENDRELNKMRRHKALLDMAVDATIAIDPEGEYGKYL